MKLYFQDSSAATITAKISAQLEKDGRYNDIVSVAPGSDAFTVTIQKLGQSRLFFAKEEDHWCLQQEKIALSHKAYKGKVYHIIEKIVLSLGGRVEKT